MTSERQQTDYDGLTEFIRSRREGPRPYSWELMAIAISTVQGAHWSAIEAEAEAKRLRIN